MGKAVFPRKDSECPFNPLVARFSGISRKKRTRQDSRTSYNPPVAGKWEKGRKAGA